MGVGRLSCVLDKRWLPGVRVVVLAVCLLAASRAQAQLEPAGTSVDPLAALQDRLINVIEQTEPSVASIARVRPSPLVLEALRDTPEARARFGAFDPDSVDFAPNDFGSGFFIAAEGATEPLLLTSYQVVRGGPVAGREPPADGTLLYVYLPERRSTLAEIVAADPRSDVAVLRINWRRLGLEPRSVRPLDWLTAPAARKGQLVVLMGNPFALARDGSASATTGMISNLARRPITSTENSPSLRHLATLLQVDTRLRLGGSGGPILDLQGRVLGMANSLDAIDGYETATCFGFPIDRSTRRIVNDLLAGYEVEYGFLGIEVESVGRGVLDIYDVPTSIVQAVKVKSVQFGSAAVELGLQAGDVITSINGQPMYAVSDLMRVVGLLAPEAEAQLTVYREDQSESLKLVGQVGKWSVPEGDAIIATKTRFPSWRGLQVDYATARMNYAVRDYAEQAVLVLTVDADSRANAAGLQPGMFITHVGRQRVLTPAEFRAAVEGLRGDVNLTLVGPRRVTVAE